MEDKDLKNNENDDRSNPEEEFKEPGPGEIQDQTAEMDEIASLKQELARKNEEAARHYEQYLRAIAELENIKKRSARDKEEYIKFANLPLIKGLLPVIDDLDRALVMSVSNQDYESLNKGVAMISKKLHELVKKEGVEAIDALGKTFDPQFHQPLAVESSKEPENTVIEELQKGYIMHGRLIRPALVKVSSS